MKFESKLRKYIWKMLFKNDIDIITPAPHVGVFDLGPLG